MSVEHHYVDVFSKDVKAMENFIYFILVQDQTVQGLSDSLLSTTDGLNLHISDCSSQCSKYEEPAKECTSVSPPL
jgi:hypothetical protein